MDAGEQVLEQAKRRGFLEIELDAEIGEARVEWMDWCWQKRIPEMVLSYGEIGREPERDELCVNMDPAAQSISMPTIPALLVNPGHSPMDSPKAITIEILVSEVLGPQITVTGDRDQLIKLAHDWAREFGIAGGLI
jgi:hypothetical protein